MNKFLTLYCHLSKNGHVTELPQMLVVFRNFMRYPNGLYSEIIKQALEHSICK